MMLYNLILHVMCVFFEANPSLKDNSGVDLKTSFAP